MMGQLTSACNALDDARNTSGEVHNALDDSHNTLDALCNGLNEVDNTLDDAEAVSNTLDEV